MGMKRGAKGPAWGGLSGFCREAAPACSKERSEGAATYGSESGRAVAAPKDPAVIDELCPPSPLLRGRTT